MPDYIPSLNLERQRVSLDIEKQKYNIKVMEFRILELMDEIQKNEINIAATKQGIKTLEDRLASMPEK